MPPWSPPAASYSCSSVRASSAAPASTRSMTRKARSAGNVDLTQGGIELHRVEYLHSVRLDDHVLGAKVTVAVAHQALLGAPLDHLGVAVQKGHREAVGARQLWRGSSRAAKGGAC